MNFNRIQIDFSAACAQANELEEIANEMKSLGSRKLAETLREMSQNWKGDSAAAYYVKSEMVQEEIISTANTLCSIAEGIRNRARKLYEAEKEVLQLAQDGPVNGGGGGGGSGF